MMKNPAPLVMVVDDDRQMLQLLALSITRHGLEVVQADSADNALTWLAEDGRLPDVIVSDVVMPGTDGLDFCRRLRLDQRTAAVPFLFLSCLKEVPDRVKGLDAGADDYLVKPFHLSELLARIRVLLRRPGQTARKAADELVDEVAETAVKAPRPSAPEEKTAPKTAAGGPARTSCRKPEKAARPPAADQAGGSPPRPAPDSFEDGEERFKAGRYEEAYTIWENLAAARPEDAELKRWLGIARQNLMRRYEQVFGSLENVPARIPNDRDDYGGLDLGSREGFVFSRIDGRSSLKELCLISGLGKMETLRILHCLFNSGVIRISRKSPQQRGKR